jgi:cytosine deaminase
LLDRDDLVDIAIEGGAFSRITPNLRQRAARELDAAGRLVTPPLIDCHVHLDAVLTAGQPRHNQSGTLIEGIQIWSERKPSLTIADVKRRALQTIQWEVAQGTLFIRSHVDVCDPSLTTLRAGGRERLAARRRPWRENCGAGGADRHALHNGAQGSGCRAPDAPALGVAGSEP